MTAVEQASTAWKPMVRVHHTSTTWKTDFKVQFIRGFPFPKTPMFPKECIESALNYVPRDDDIIISTYPKTGTNWVKYIVWEILNKGAPLPSTYELHFRVAPAMEAAGAAAAEALPPPRLIQFHLPYHLIPKNPICKYIYVVRNPKDTLVSYYHYVQEADEMEILFDDYFESFITGSVTFGDYFDHVLSWYRHRHDPNLLFLSYERLKADPRGELFKIADFLGEEYSDLMKRDESLVSTILEQTSFKFMKKELDKSIVVKGTNLGSVSISKEEMFRKEAIPNFFRKGITGDWRSHFSREQNERFEKRIAEKLNGTDVAKLWTL